VHLLLLLVLGGTFHSAAEVGLDLVLVEEVGHERDVLLFEGLRHEHVDRTVEQFGPVLPEHVTGRRVALLDVELGVDQD